MLVGVKLCPNAMTNVSYLNENRSYHNILSSISSGLQLDPYTSGCTFRQRKTATIIAYT